jgi:hypothetical protein
LNIAGETSGNVFNDLCVISLFEIALESNEAALDGLNKLFLIGLGLVVECIGEHLLNNSHVDGVGLLQELSIAVVHHALLDDLELANGESAGSLFVVALLNEDDLLAYSYSVELLDSVSVNVDLDKGEGDLAIGISARGNEFTKGNVVVLKDKLVGLILHALGVLDVIKEAVDLSRQAPSSKNGVDAIHVGVTDIEGDIREYAADELAEVARQGSVH